MSTGADIGEAGRVFYTVAGQRLETRWIHREHSGPVLVFLHEGLGSVSTWRDVPDELARATGKPAFVYSRAGYGQSDAVSLPRPLDYMQHEGIHVLPLLLEQAEISEAILIGHSDGASIALVYAATEHGIDRVRQVVLEAPHVFCEAKSVASIERAKRAYENEDLRERLHRHHRDVDVAFYGWNRAWLDPGFARWGIEDHVSRVRAPILAIQSDDDPYGTLGQIDAVAENCRGPFERLILSECGHAPHRDRRDVVIAAITTFVELQAARER